MLAIVNAVSEIARMSPPALPGLRLPELPNLDSVTPLAEVSGTDPAPLLQAANVLLNDRTELEHVMGNAQQLTIAAGQDIVGIGAQLVTQAVPYAVMALSPIPGTRAAGLRMLESLAVQFVARASHRLLQLRSELAESAQALEPVTRRMATQLTTGGQDAVAQLEGTTAHNSNTVEATAQPASLVTQADGAEPTAQGQAAVDAAMSQLGQPYVWGGTGNWGFDCSGLTQWAWRQAGVELPRLAQDQTVGRQVSADELIPGDLVVWDGHVAMYAGDGQIVEAGSPVSTSPLRTTNMGMAFKGFWRPTG